MALRLFVLSALLLTTSVIAAQTSSSPDPICDVTRPNGRGAFGETPSSSLFGNGALSTGLWPDGTIEFKPGGPGFVTRDGALGMGLTERQVLWRIEVPLALPEIFAGVRIATTTTVGLAALAFFAGAGGLGGLIFRRQGAGKSRDRLATAKMQS